MKCVPVALFVYNRKEHTKKTVEALSFNFLAKETDLYIFADAAKGEADADKVMEVRQYIQSIPKEKFRSIHIRQQEKNKGLASSIIDGVTEIVNKNGKIIVLEDDLVSSPYFLRYMNYTLEKYEKCPDVYEISGYSFLAEYKSIIDKLFLPEYYFLRMATSWGWGTWKDRWGKFDINAVGWEELLTNKELSFHFSLNGTIDYSQMLIDQMTKGIDSWAVKWWWVIFQNSGLTLFPKESFIKNIGMDGTGVHGVHRLNDSPVKMDRKYKESFPDDVIQKKWIYKRLLRAYKPGFMARVKALMLKL